MRKTTKGILLQRLITIGIILLFIGACFLPAFARDTRKPSPTLGGNWLYVGGSGPGNYTTIQSAINAANTGDTVFVYSGTYYGHVNINKTINLIGEEKNSTVIIGYVAYTLSFNSDWVNMNGFTIQNGARSGEGVRIDSNNNTFFDNIVRLPNDEFRIFGDNNTIARNTISGDSIFLSGECNTITGNTLTNTDYGIYVVESWDNVISNNSFFYSGLFFSDPESAWSNIVLDNTVNSKPLLYRYNESDYVIDSDAGQIILINCTNITIQHQEINNTTVGLQIFRSDACTISENTISGNDYGIWLSGWNNTLRDNTISENNFALHLSGDHNTIFHNMISDNDVSIDVFWFTDFNNIINNTIINTQSYGIGLLGDDNTIIGNTLTNNSDGGISFFGDRNIIASNTIKSSYSNDTVGIIGPGDNNTISENTINNNQGGINLFGNNNIISKNTVTQTRLGILLYENHNIISNNTIANNHDGLILVFCTQCIAISNTIIENENGITLDSDSTHNFISGNTITSNNHSGIFLNCSNNNTISQNSISKNTYGVSLVSSSDNTILKNNFLRNTRHTLFENCTNQWNRNYWGRPRILPKIVFGTIEKNFKEIRWFNIDWRPALLPYHIE
jgi:parallel beta-helix repeat protein